MTYSEIVDLLNELHAEMPARRDQIESVREWARSMESKAAFVETVSALRDEQHGVRENLAAINAELQAMRPAVVAALEAEAAKAEIAERDTAVREGIVAWLKAAFTPQIIMLGLIAVLVGLAIVGALYGIGVSVETGAGTVSVQP